ncbi:MAG: hypothetical protein WCO00_17650 [Rhodospirillaceae bacterium]
MCQPDRHDTAEGGVNNIQDGGKITGQRTYVAGGKKLIETTYNDWLSRASVDPLSDKIDRVYGVTYSIDAKKYYFIVGCAVEDNNEFGVFFQLVDKTASDLRGMRLDIVYRFDSDAPISANWKMGDMGSILMDEDAIKFIRQAIGKKSVVVKISLMGATNDTRSYSLIGMSDAISDSLARCKIKL